MGRPLGSKNKNKIPLVERLYSKVIIDPVTNCWNMKPFNKQRYPALQVNDKLVRASRLSYEIYHKKKIKKGKCCLHQCDNTHCINPKHLFLGTHKQNMRDMIKKGRDRKDPPVGSRCAQHKLTENEVITIRESLTKISGRNNISEKYREIAKKYNVSTHTIYSLNKRITWKHI